MRKEFLRRILWIACVSMLMPALAEARAKFSWEEHQIIDKNWPKAIETSTGLLYIVKHETKGPKPKPGDMVSVLYTGSLINGTIFDQKVDPKDPFTFRNGRGEVIDGWDEAISMMHEGEKWVIVVPAELAYGSRGRLPTIPRNAGLVFEVELIKVESVE